MRKIKYNCWGKSLDSLPRRQMGPVNVILDEKNESFGVNLNIWHKLRFFFFYAQNEGCLQSFYTIFFHSGPSCVETALYAVFICLRT